MRDNSGTDFHMEMVLNISKMVHFMKETFTRAKNMGTASIGGVMAGSIMVNGSIIVRKDMAS